MTWSPYKIGMNMTWSHSLFKEIKMPSQYFDWIKGCVSCGYGVPYPGLGREADFLKSIDPYKPLHNSHPLCFHLLLSVNLILQIREDNPAENTLCVTLLQMKLLCVQVFL